MPAVRRDESRAPSGRGAFEVRERWGRGNPRGQLRGDRAGGEAPRPAPPPPAPQGLGFEDGRSLPDSGQCPRYPSTPAPQASAPNCSLGPASARCSPYPGWESRGGQAAQSLPRTPLGQGWVLPTERRFPRRRRPATQPPQWPRTPLGMFQKETRTPACALGRLGPRSIAEPAWGAGEPGLRALAAGAWVRRRHPGDAGPPPPRPPGTSGTPLAGRAAAAPSAPPRGGGEGSAGVKGHVSPPQAAENVFQLPQEMEKKIKYPPLHASGWRFCFCYCEGGGQKAKLST